MQKIIIGENFIMGYWDDDFIDFLDTIYEKPTDELWYDHLQNIGGIDKIRTDPVFIEAVENINFKLKSTCLCEDEYKVFKVIEIPDNIKWESKSNDLNTEYICEKHRTWS